MIPPPNYHIQAIAARVTMGAVRARLERQRDYCANRGRFPLPRGIALDTHDFFTVDVPVVDAPTLITELLRQSTLEFESDRLTPAQAAFERRVRRGRITPDVARG